MKQAMASNISIGPRAGCDYPIVAGLKIFCRVVKNQLKRKLGGRRGKNNKSVALSSSVINSPLLEPHAFVAKSGHASVLLL